MKNYKLLVICGGGIFGYIPAKFISSIYNREHFKLDAIAGTSIGGILASMISYGIPTTEIAKKFKELSSLAFSRPWYSKFNPFGPKYNGKGLETALSTLFSDDTLKSLEIPVFIPTIDFIENKPKIYDSFNRFDENELIANVCRKTSAAPTYFPPKDGFIDGGIIANNPTLIAVAGLRNKKKIRPENIDILVIDTGHKRPGKYDEDEIEGWSAFRWLSPILDYITEGNEMSTHFISNEIDFHSYQYFNPVELDPDWKMDNVSLIPEMDKLVEPYIEEFQEVFEKFMHIH